MRADIWLSKQSGSWQADKARVILLLVLLFEMMV